MESSQRADAGAEQRFGVQPKDGQEESAALQTSLAGAAATARDLHAVLSEAREIVGQAAPQPKAEAKIPAWKQGVAELVGTAALCFIGILVLTAGGEALFANGTKNLVAVALAHGLTIAVMVSATMAISGGQLNPAVTFALWITRKLPTGQAAVNCTAQIAGAVFGSFLAKVAIGGAITGGIPALASGVSTSQGIVTEAVLTFFLVFVIFGTAVDPRFGAKLGGLAIGLTVTLDILAGGPITGGAMNTARWFGPALVQGTFPNPVVYLVGPLVGGAAAALLWTTVLMNREPKN